MPRVSTKSSKPKSNLAKKKNLRKFKLISGLIAFVIVAVGAAAASQLAKISQENRSSASGCQLGVTSCSNSTGLLWECDGNSFQQKDGPVVCNQALVDEKTADSSFRADGSCKGGFNRCVDGYEQYCGEDGKFVQGNIECGGVNQPANGQVCAQDDWQCKDGKSSTCECLLDGSNCSWQRRTKNDNDCTSDYYAWGAGNGGGQPSSSQPNPGEPLGWIDSINTQTISGWAVDPDRKEESIDVHFYLDGPAGSGTFMGAVRADRPRPDVNTHLGLVDSSAKHGYDFSIPSNFMDGKAHTVYAHGIDLTGNANQLLEPKAGFKATFPATKEPVGWIDSITGTTISGWAADPDLLFESIDVHFYLDGPAGSGIFMGAVPTTIQRDDVNTHLGPGSAGRKHGYSFSIPRKYLDGKEHTIYAHGIDLTGNANQLLEPKTGKVGTFSKATLRAKILGIF
jgi:hypothetical protein